MSKVHKVSEENEILNGQQPPKQVIQSEYFSTYQKIMEQSIDCSVKNLTSIMELNTNILHQIQRQNQFSCKFSISSEHPYVVEAKVIAFGYDFNLLLLNLNKTCEIEKMQKISSGNFGHIFRIFLNNQEIAIKTILFQGKNRIKSYIVQAIKEYCFIKIASICRFGPLAKDYLGFHLVVYRNAIQFAMEKIEPVDKLTKQFEQDLYENLAVMHSLRMIHYDIKPQNIGYSKLQGRAVFLDFGLSQIVQQALGSKTFIYFRGSVSFCGKAMLKLFVDTVKANYIDVYYNDLECLQKTIEISKQQARHMQSSDQDLDNQQFDYGNYSANIVSALNSNFCFQMQATVQCLLVLLFFYICKGSIKQARKIIQKNKLVLIKLNEPIIDFLQHCHMSDDLKRFIQQDLVFLRHSQSYHRLIKKSCKKNMQWSICTSSKNYPDSEEINERYALDISIKRDYPENDANTLVCIFEQFEKPDTEQAQQAYFTIYLRLMRFDESFLGISFEEKARLARIFNATVLSNHQISEDNSLEAIQKSMIFLQTYCQTKPYNCWKKTHIFSVVTQNIIVDSNIITCLSTFQKCIFQMANTSDTALHLFLDLQRVIRIEDRKYKTNYSFTFAKMRSFFISLQSTLQKIIIKESHIAEIFRILRNEQYKYKTTCCFDHIQRYQQHFQKIKDDVALAKMRSFVLANQLIKCMSTNNFNLCFKFMAAYHSIMINSITKGRKIRLQMGFIEIYQLNFRIKNVREVQNMAQMIKEAMGSDVIFGMFKFQMNLFQLKGSSDEKILIDYLKQLLSNPNQNQSYVFQTYHTIIFQAFGKKSQDFTFSYTAVKNWIDCLIEKATEKWTDNHFFLQNALFYSCILNKSLKTIASQQLLHYKGLVLEKMKKLLDDSSGQDHFFIEIVYHLLTAVIAISNQYFQQSLESFQILVKMIEPIKCFKLEQFCYINCFRLGQMLNDITVTKKYAILNLQFCKKAQSFMTYFTYEKQLTIRQTFLAIKDNEVSVYELFQHLAEHIFIFPFENYFKNWIGNLSSIYLKFPQIYSYEKIDSLFSKKLDKNPYLLIYYLYSLMATKQKIEKKMFFKIAFRIGLLKYFGKFWVLMYYYDKILFSGISSERKIRVFSIRQSFKYKKKQNIQKPAIIMKKPSKCIRKSFVKQLNKKYT